MSLFHSVPRSIGYAGSGIKTAIGQEPNFRIHVCAMILAIGAGLFLGLTSLEWAILILTIALVLILELVNTSLEAIVNMVSPEIRPAAKVAKDTAAGAVLLAAIAACLIGMFLFLPKIF